MLLPFVFRINYLDLHVNVCYSLLGLFNLPDCLPNFPAVVSYIPLVSFFLFLNQCFQIIDFKLLLVKRYWKLRPYSNKPSVSLSLPLIEVQEISRRLLQIWKATFYASVNHAQSTLLILNRAPQYKLSIGRRQRGVNLRLFHRLMINGL